MGNATISVPPDQVKLNVGVVVQAATAQEAAAQNAGQVSNVLAQLGKVLGASGETRTVGYSISPVYKYAQGQPAQLVGYSATNTVEITSRDLSLAGKLIDAAAQSGATNIGGLRFGVRNEEPVRAQALAAAARQARAQAEAIANGLGGHAGTVLSAEEGAVSTIVPLVETRTDATTPATPVEPGLVQIQATVTVRTELL